MGHLDAMLTMGAATPLPMGPRAIHGNSSGRTLIPLIVRR
jgi:hypothetical protein